MAVALAGTKDDGSSILEHGGEVGHYDGLGEQVLACAVERRALPFPALLVVLIVAAMTGGKSQVAALQALADDVGARYIADPCRTLVASLAPQASVVFVLEVDVGDELLDALVAHQDGDVVIVDGARQHLAQVGINLLYRLGAKGLVGKVGVGMHGERALLWVEGESHQFACTHIDQRRLVGAKVALQTLLYDLLLRLGREVDQRETKQKEDI